MCVVTCGCRCGLFRCPGLPDGVRSDGRRCGEGVSDRDRALCPSGLGRSKGELRGPGGCLSRTEFGVRGEGCLPRVRETRQVGRTATPVVSRSDHPRPLRPSPRVPPRPETPGLPEPSIRSAQGLVHNVLVVYRVSRALDRTDTLGNSGEKFRDGLSGVFCKFTLCL